eukprot:SAG31_NODE_843_length_11551_cov_6.757772_5_plen_100_part_00
MYLNLGTLLHIDLYTDACKLHQLVLPLSLLVLPLNHVVALLTSSHLWSRRIRVRGVGLKKQIKMYLKVLNLSMYEGYLNLGTFRYLQLYRIRQCLFLKI